MTTYLQSQVLRRRIQEIKLIVTCYLLVLFFPLRVISERELTFAFAICYRPSVCRLSVTFVRPTHAIAIFGNISTSFGTLTICDLSIKNFREIVPEEPLRRGGELNRRVVAKYRDFGPFQGYLGNGAR